MDPVYLDHNATTPLHPRVVAAMRPYLEEHFGNPSSAHVYGQRTRDAVDRARDQVAALLGCAPDEVVFTSGGTEANNHAIRGIARALEDRGRHLVISAVEHPAVTNVCSDLAERGWEVTTLPVDGYGRVDPADLDAALRPDTVLVSVMLANNEVGTLQPIASLTALAHRAGALLHTDAAQAVGKVPVRVDGLDADLLSVAGHKLYAPKGVGCLYVRRGTPLPRFMHGADHERGLRAGTENVMQIVGLGEAAAVATEDLPASMARTREIRDALQALLTTARPDAVVHGHPEHRLPNTLSISFPGVEANALLDRVSADVAASAGAACHSGEVHVSGVLAAMGVSPLIAMGTIRLSVGRPTTLDDVDRAAAALLAALG